MPFKLVPAELVCEHKGVEIYHVYNRDDIDCGLRTYWYSVSCYSREDDSFDVRDLNKLLKKPYKNEQSHTFAWDVLHKAIDEGLITIGMTDEDVRELIKREVKHAKR